MLFTPWFSTQQFINLLMSLFFFYFILRKQLSFCLKCVSVWGGGEQLANGFSIIAWELHPENIKDGEGTGTGIWKGAPPHPRALFYLSSEILIQQKVLWSATTASLQNLVLLYLCHWLILLSPNVPRKPSYMLGFHRPGSYRDPCQTLSRSLMCISGVNNLYCGDPFS